MRFVRTTALAVCIVLGAASAARAQFTFDDIEYWVGEGDNQAALVIDWVSGNDPLCLAWGYRWDGVATGEDMLMAIAGVGDVRSENNGPVVGSVDGDDARLGAQVTVYDDFGNSVFGLGYDVDDDGGFVYVNGPNETGHAADADDNYHEGFMGGYWSYWLGAGNPYQDGSWEAAMVGMGDRTLATGDWDGWSFAAGGWGTETAPAEPVAAVPVPEPAMILAAFGVLFAALRRRKR